MKCPSCQTELRISERQGVEIDYCPQCRGVWLDRGELDKILDRIAQETPAVPAYRAEGRYDRDDDRRSPAHREYGRDDDYWRGGEHRDYERDEYYRKRKRKGWLGELFDFD